MKKGGFRLDIRKKVSWFFNFYFLQGGCGETLKWVAQKGSGCPVPGHAQVQAEETEQPN